jgi:hypothetical protein
MGGRDGVPLEGYGGKDQKENPVKHGITEEVEEP